MSSAVSFQTGVLTPEAGEQELDEFLANVRPLVDVMHNYEVLHKVTAHTGQHTQ